MSPKLAGVCALLGFSVLLGTFATIVFAPHVHRQYDPAWRDASWITSSGARAVAYFRKELVLPSLPVKGYVQIAAPDGFDLYVNKTLIQGKILQNTATLVSASTSASHDISRLLKVGKNVLAVKVKLQTTTAQPVIIVDGVVRDQSGAVHRLASNSTWRVSAKEEWQAARTVAWFDPAFTDEEWPPATEVSEPAHRPMQLLDLPPRLFENFPRGQWMWNQDRAEQNPAFQRTFTLRGRKLNEAWLGISGDTGYSLAINDITLAAGTSGGPFMNSYDIARYLRWGENRVDIAATAVPPLRAPRLVVSLMAEVDGEWLDFSSDSRWLSKAAPGPEAIWTPAAIGGAMASIPLNLTQLGYPSLQIVRLSPPLAWWLERGAAVAAWSALLLFANVALIWLIAGAAYRKTVRVAVVYAAWAQPSAAAAVVLFFLFLLQFDVRVTQASVFQPAVFFAVWSVTLLWAALPLFAPGARVGAQAHSPGGPSDG